MINFSEKQDKIAILLLGMVFFLPFLGGVHLFDWDEINFAECAREMITTGNYLRVHINYEPFWEKPPLFFWLQAGAMHLFGIGEYAARFPNAVIGILSLLILYEIGKKHYNRTFAWLWVLCYLGSILPHLYFKSGIIDPVFNFFIFLSLYFFYFIFLNFSWRYALFAGTFAGMAVLTKGPVAYLIISTTVFIYYFLSYKKTVSALKKHFFSFISFSVATFLITMLWFGVEIMQNGTWFVETFIKYQIRLFQTEDAGHGGFFGYHAVVLLLGCFPSSFFALKILFKKSQNDVFQKVMKILFWVVLILFSIIKTKIVHYSSLCYYPITFLAAKTLFDVHSEGLKIKILEKIIFIIGLTISFLLIILPFVGQHIALLKPFFSRDEFALANIEAPVIWSGFEALAGVFLLTSLFLWRFFWKKQKFWNGIIALFGGVAIFVQLTLFFIINNIEGYSQRAAIDFFKEKSKENCYVVVEGYKSYAQLFYTQKNKPAKRETNNRVWLFHDTIDKPVYVVTKITYADIFREMEPNFEEINRKNGFVFFVRKP